MNLKEAFKITIPEEIENMRITITPERKCLITIETINQGKIYDNPGNFINYEDFFTALSNYIDHNGNEKKEDAIFAIDSFPVENQLTDKLTDVCSFGKCDKKGNLSMEHLDIAYDATDLEAQTLCMNDLKNITTKAQRKSGQIHRYNFTKEFDQNVRSNPEMLLQVKKQKNRIVDALKKDEINGMVREAIVEPVNKQEKELFYGQPSNVSTLYFKKSKAKNAVPRYVIIDVNQGDPIAHELLDVYENVNNKLHATVNRVIYHTQAMGRHFDRMRKTAYEISVPVSSTSYEQGEPGRVR